MNAMIPFYFENAPMRVMLIDEAPWWVAKDLCDILGLGNARMALKKLDDDQKGVNQIDTLGGPQTLNIVCESGMWTLVVRSDKPEAKLVRRWLTDEVLPALRKTGSYTMPGMEVLPAPQHCAIEDSDVPRLSVCLGIVREHRRLFGTNASRAVWLELGLPRGSATTLSAREARADSAADDPLLEAVRDFCQTVDCATAEDVAEAIGLELGEGLKNRLRIGRMLKWLGWSSKPEFRRGVGKVNLWRPELPLEPEGEAEVLS